MTDNVLCLSGIPGMKWGVRRFQNEDGTLTAAGKERYRPSGQNEGESSFESKMTRDAIARKESDPYTTAKGLSDQELTNSINRMRNEKTYADLVNEQRNRDKKIYMVAAAAVGAAVITLGKTYLNRVAVQGGIKLGDATIDNVSKMHEAYKKTKALKDVAISAVSK